MPLEAHVHGVWLGKQTAKGTENTTPAHRMVLQSGDMETQRDDGKTNWSDLNKYGGHTDYVNSVLGQGTPVFEATPSETGFAMWAAHGAETVTAGTDNVQTLGGSPGSGTFTLLIDDGGQNLISVPGIANNVASAALATSINAAMLAAGHTGTPVVCTGGPLNTTPITVTFSGVTTAKRPFTLSKTADTTSPAVSITNTTPGVRTKPQALPGHWLTLVRRVGATVVQRHSYVDTLVNGITLEAATSQKEVRLGLNLLSLNPGKVLTSDPTANLPTGIDLKPFLYTDGAGAFTIDGTVFRGQSQFQFSTTEGRTPVPGDDVTVHDLAVSNPGVTIGCTIVFDSDGLGEWNKLFYGTATPAAGTLPLKNIPPLGSYSAVLTQKTPNGNPSGNKLGLTIPGVKWTVPPAPAPNPEGGNTEIALAGEMRPISGLDPYTIDTWNGDPSAYTA